MIISIDGADGVGKTTLAKRLAEYINFEFIKDPLDEIVRLMGDKQERKEAAQHAKTHVYHSGKTNKQIANYIGNCLLSLRAKASGRNIILDRGMMSASIYNLDDETEALFDGFLKKGAVGDICIFLYASQDVRYQRLKTRAQTTGDIHDDLHNSRVLALDSTRTIEFIKSRNVNSIIIDTSNKNSQQVFEEVIKFLRKNPVYLQNKLGHER